ncbi:MAG: HAMP domain-containing protein [Verrucomicrobia bacterium]|nr:HAMP domain-containing protein [Verrucomicrobiota bacterium]
MKLRNVPIQRKLTIIIMLTTSMVLAVTSIAFITYEVFSFRSTLVQEMKTVGAVIAANSTAAVAFNDEGAATEILSALRAEENVLSAALYDANGSLLARYSPDASKTDFPPLPDFTGYRFEQGALLLVQPVERAETRVGTLFIQSDLRDIYNRLGLYGLIVALVMAGSFLMAFVISRWVQRSISHPILELAQTARTVSEKKDYSVRAQKFGEDELGELTNAFNDMLRQLGNRDVELFASRERLKLALSASQTGTWEWNLEANQMVWDEFTKKLFGIDRGTFSGGSGQLIEKFHPQDRPTIMKAVEATLLQGKELKVEGRVIWPDGSEHHLALRGKAVSDGPEAAKFNRVTGVCLDITDRRRAEERIRRMNAELEERVLRRTSELTASHQEMEAFTYSVSHDLRAPLRHITAFAEILEEEFSENFGEEARDYLQRILRGTESMSQLVDDLLNLARIGRQGLSLQKVDINIILHEIVADFQPEMKERNIHWEIEYIPEVSADPGLIRQVLANLISNAIKYTRPRKEATIHIGSDIPDGEIIIFIRDNGVGFDMKFVDKLFGAFQRLHRSEDFEGTGVGLALTERIVRKHGGRVWAQSELGKGATFYFSLPIVGKRLKEPEFETAGKMA